MKKLLVVQILFLIVITLSSGCIHNQETPELPYTENGSCIIETPEIPGVPPIPIDRHSFTLPSIHEYLELLNERYNLALTGKEISAYVKELENTEYVLDAELVNDGIRIKNFVGFQIEVTRVMNLDQAIHDELIEMITDQPGVNTQSEPNAINVDWYLSRINDMYDLGFTEEELQSYSEDIKKMYFKDAERVDSETGYYILVSDMIGFLNEISQVMNLDEETRDDVIIMFKDVVIY